MPDAPATPTKPPEREGMVVFGVDPTLSEQDAQIVAFAVMATVICATNERGDIPASRPLYEFPLLKRRYLARGGQATVSDEWLYHPKKKAQAVYARTVPMTRLMIAQEMARLQQAYTDNTSGGKVSIFDKVYGTGVNNRFKKTVIEQAKAYRNIDAKCKQEQRRITRDELVYIASIGEPESEGEKDLEVVPLIDENLASDLPMVDETDSTLDKIQNFLTEKGHSAEVALAVVQLHQTNKVTAESLGLVSALSQKKQQILEVLRNYKEAIEAAKA